MEIKIKKIKIPYWLIIVLGFVEIIVLMIGIFLLAGKIDYWQGWVFGIAMLLLIPIILLIFKDKKDLAQERISPGPGVKWWDKVFWYLFAPMYIVVLIISVLDTGRYIWSPEFPLIIYVISYLLFAYSIYFTLWAMWVNKWFSSAVRIQKDREQKVVQTGPYKYVRHPGYVGAILMVATTALIFGSLWALIPAGIIVILFLIRTYLEDETLKKELEGYKEYTKKTKYRLIPGIW